VFQWQLRLGCFQSTEHIKAETNSGVSDASRKHPILYPSDLDKKNSRISKLHKPTKKYVHWTDLISQTKAKSIQFNTKFQMSTKTADFKFTQYELNTVHRLQIL